MAGFRCAEGAAAHVQRMLNGEDADMARRVRDKNLESRDARLKLKPNGNPRYRSVERGAHLGYRRLRGRAGTWWARFYIGEQKYTVEAIGAADDFSKADGVEIFGYDEAVEKVRERRKLRAHAAAGKTETGPYTVNAAADDYLAYLRDVGRDEAAIKDATTRIEAFIRPPLGHLEVAALTSKQLRGWLANLVKAAPRLRTIADEKQKHRKSKDERARKATANRILTTLKALLNHAYDEEMVPSNKTWGRRVKPFEAADAARPRYLTIDEAKRLVNASDAEFRPLVQAALLTGGRYGQIAKLKVADFNPDTGTVDFRSKKGRGEEKSFSCVLSDEGIQFFKQVSAGRAGSDLIFTKANGEPWLKSHQARPMAEACDAAKIVPRVGIHQLRHTWATHSVVNGIPLVVVAKNLGHSDTRMVEKFYGNIGPSYVAEEIRKGAPRFGIAPLTNVRPIR
jgi:integrase